MVQTQQKGVCTGLFVVPDLGRMAEQRWALKRHTKGRDAVDNVQADGRGTWRRRGQKRGNVEYGLGQAGCNVAVPKRTQCG